MAATELAPLMARNAGLIETVKSIGDIWHLADILLQSGFLPPSIRTPAAATAIILKGHELGIGPMHSFDSISVIQGKPTISPQLMLALIERSGLVEDLQVEEGPDRVAITLKRRGRSPQNIGFDRAEAVAMGLANKENWKKQFGVMMYWRCVAKACRRVFPDVIAGCYTPEEMGAEVNEDGEVIDVEAPKPSKFASNDSGFGRTGSYASPEQVTAMNRRIAELGKAWSEEWQDAWIGENKEFPPGLPELPIRSFGLIGHLYKHAVAAGKLAPPPETEDPESGAKIPKASIEQKRQMIAIVFHRDRDWWEEEARYYFLREAASVAQKFVAEVPDWNLPPDYDIAAEDEPEEPQPVVGGEMAEPPWAAGRE